MAARFGKEFLSKDNPGAPDTEKVLAAYQEKWNITPEQYKARVARQLAAEEKVAKAGEPAPDFTAEMLSADGARTGRPFRLAEARGHAIALTFGSYT